MTMSWHMMVDFEPPGRLCGQQRGLQLCRNAVSLAQTVVKIGNCSGRDVAKFDTFDLTPVPADLVQAPLIAECFANLECKLVDRRLVSKYNIFVLEVIKAWIDPAQKHPRTTHHHGHGTFVLDGETIRFISKMP